MSKYHGYAARARQFAHKHPMLVRTAGFVAAMGVGLAHASRETRLPGTLSPVGHGPRYSHQAASLPST